MHTSIISAIVGIFLSVAYYATGDNLTAVVGIISFLISMLAADIHQIKKSVEKSKCN